MVMEMFTLVMSKPKKNVNNISHLLNDHKRHPNCKDWYKNDWRD